MREMVGGCCVCSDDRGWSENPLVYCDGQSCTVAVHQACYGIVTVPTGPWYCRKCESQERSVKVKCELCPSKYGALKRTDNSGWAHVVCALYIPEVRFGNVTTMEPIQLQLIPPERFNKLCYICEEKGKPSNATVGACMQCNRVGCKQQFHVTCAQGLGLLCEEAGNYLDNVKYCGYCQYHYSKLKKGGNVKTIPPYKPVSEAHNSDSNSEREPDNSAPSNSKTGVSPPSSGKRKALQGGAKPPAAKNASKGVANQQQKGYGKNANEKGGRSTSTAAKSAKSDENASAEVSDKKEPDSEQQQRDKDSKDAKGSSKKRKVNSRTPTPVSVTPSEVSVTAVSSTSTTTTVNAISSSANTDKKASSSSEPDKIKKVKVETTQSILSNQPVVALTSISSIKTVSPVVTVETTTTTSTDTVVSTSSVVQTTSQVHSQSLVVSVPLVNTSLSPHKGVISSQSTVSLIPVAPERTASQSATPVISENLNMIGGNSNQDMLTPEMNTGGLKIVYEKQVDSINTEVDMEIEHDIVPSSNVEVPAKRGRSQSQSNEKADRANRNKKRNSTGSSNSNPLPAPVINNVASKKLSRMHVTPPPESPGAFSSITQAQIKDSPPSSPSSESQSLPSTTGSRRLRTRKSDPKESKDVKIFQNGLSAPHMLGNQLNPNSTMHSKMSDHLSNELEAHSIFNPHEHGSSLVGPQLHHRVLQSARASSTASSTASGGSSGLSNMLGGGGGNIPQTLDQLLERQWEQGSQFLMEQAQHFDIASLLSCLHQLRAENLRLEEHVSSLIQRRDHLLAVNARLAIPLTGQPAAAPLSSHPHSVNNIHPSVAAVHGEVPRSSRHSGGASGYPTHPQASAQHPPMENGLPPDAYSTSTHRSRSPGNRQSPNMRNSPAGAYPNSSLHRQNADSSGRSAPRPQPYPLYDRPGPSAQQQMVIRRDRGDRDPDMFHRSSSNPS
ncbi:unnamed protein product [Phyllotreta striolata]|uniref:Protein AF-10 n=1 Tax=Phyllotreta striolata TaxID=444603 RepID=A0A9N9TWF5_PHYSR|nr:unnamed protein product [Phyllotreta striolata]